MREFSKMFWCLSLTSLCLMAGSAQWSAQAAAQSGNEAHGGKSSNRAAKKKEVRFEVISIRPVKPGWSPYSGNVGALGNTAPSPDGFTSTLTVWQMLMIAYAQVDQSAWDSVPIANAPKWLSNIPPELYNINAHVPEADIEAWRNQDFRHELLRSAMQDLLKTRCKLVAHEEPTELPDYKLVIRKGGPKMKAWHPGSPLPANGHPLPTGGVRFADGPRATPTWHYYGATIGELVEFLSLGSPNRPIHDGTGLTGRYNFAIQVIDDPSRTRDERVFNLPVTPLGLELKPGKYPGFKLVTDHLERPTPN